MRKISLLGLALLTTLVAFADRPAKAQNSLVVATCGTLRQAYQVGSSRQPTVDVNGETCGAAVLSGTTSVNLTQILGAAPSAANPIWVLPGTASVWPVAGVVATGAAAAGAGNPVYIAGIDDGNLIRPFRVNSNGNIYANMTGITQGGTAFTGSGFGTVVMGTDGTNGQVLLMDSNKNLLVSAGGAPNLATAQVSVTTGNISVAAARALRRAVTITNVTGTSAIYCGNTGVATTTGTYLGGTAGSSITLNTTAAIFCTVASITQTVTVAETY